MKRNFLQLILVKYMQMMRKMFMKMCKIMNRLKKICFCLQLMNYKKSKKVRLKKRVNIYQKIVFLLNLQMNRTYLINHKNKIRFHLGINLNCTVRWKKLKKLILGTHRLVKNKINFNFKYEFNEILYFFIKLVKLHM